MKLFIGGVLLWTALIPGCALHAQNSANPTPAYVRLTPADRWHLYWKDMGNPVSVVASAMGAGIGQWRNEPEEWGQGGSGYGKRFANGYAMHLVRTSLQHSTAALLHEDNRYVASNETGVGRRLRYAVFSTFRARREDGTRKVSISRIGSLGATALISRTWQPDSSRTWHDAGSSFAISVGVATGFGVAREFLPAIFNRK